LPSHRSGQGVICRKRGKKVGDWVKKDPIASPFQEGNKQALSQSRERSENQRPKGKVERECIFDRRGALLAGQAISGGRAHQSGERALLETGFDCSSGEDRTSKGG